MDVANHRQRRVLLGRQKMPASHPHIDSPDTANVVVTSDAFSPSTVTRSWLISNQIVTEPEILPGSVFAETAVQVQTSKFELLMLKSVLQFAPRKSVEPATAAISDPVKLILTGLQVPAFTGFAINFSWVYFPDGGDSVAWTRKMFYREDVVPYSLFSSPDSRFGAYLSTDFDGLRLKLDIKPVSKMTDRGTPTCAVDFSFNYTSDLEGAPSESISRIVGKLSDWNTLRSSAFNIVDKILEAGK